MAAGRKRPAALALLPEVVGACCWRAWRRLRRWRRRNWFYRRLLKGPLADRIAFHPYDALPRRLEDADALLRGRFRFDGETVEVEGPLDLRSAAAVARLGGGAARFRLAAAAVGGGRRSGAHAGDQSDQPMAEAQRALFRTGLVAACHGAAPDRTSSRHGRFVLANSDMLWRSKLFVSLREQSRMLARIAGEAPDGLPRLEAAAALALVRRLPGRQSAPAGSRAGAPRGRNRAPDPARRRTYQPLARGAGACLSPYRDGDGRARRHRPARRRRRCAARTTAWRR